MRTKSKRKPTKKVTSPVIRACFGVDVGGSEFVVTYKKLHADGAIRIGGSKKFNNTTKGIASFYAWINNKHKSEDIPFCVLMEATGVYYESLAYYLTDKNLSVKVILPNQSKAYGKSLNIKSKNDKIDSGILAQLGVERPSIRTWLPASSRMRTLKKLSRQRTRLVEDKTRLTNQIHAEQASYQPDKTIIKQDKKRLAVLKKQIKEIEEKMVNLLKKDDPDLYQKIENICQLKGLGLITVIAVIVETNGFELFHSIKQLISYAGYDVVEKQSGKTHGKTKISKKGNKHIRRALHMPSLSVVRLNPDSPFSNLYQRVFERTAIKMKGYVAVQRKMLILIYTLFNNDQAYNADFHKNACSLKLQTAL